MENIDKLYSSLCVPSSANAYGVAIEYMKNWFLSKFDEDYWKTVHIDSKFVLDDFRQFNIHDSLKKLKPSVSITPQVSFEHDREKVDLYQGGIHSLIRRSKIDSSFFKDIKNNMFIGIYLDQLQMNFTFRMRVSTRAQQMELYNYIKMAFRIGSTQGEDINMDFHIPYSLMLQVAKDAGFEIRDKQIINVLAFVKYLNGCSIIPVLYKYRNMNGRNEFFLRFTNMYTHISCLDYPSADDGEREGHLYNNYIIEMQAILKIPTPKAYAYYSLEKHDTIRNIDGDPSGTTALTSIQIIDTPEVNAKGWDKFIVTDYYSEDISKPLSIDFAELFEGSDILTIIKYNNSILISSNVFIDFKIYNNNKEINYTINWETLRLDTDVIVDSNTTSIVIYTDLNYINDAITNLKQLSKDRLR